MVTSAFLFKVIVYGLIAAVIIPAIDLILVMFREGRRSGDHPAEGTNGGASWQAAPAERSPRVRRIVAQQNRRRPVEATSAPASNPVGGDGVAPARPQHSESAALARPQVAQHAASARPQHAQSAAPAQRQQAQHAASARPQHAQCVPPARRQQHPHKTPFAYGYVASNGVTVTPSPFDFHSAPAGETRRAEPKAPRTNHPHAEYWSYGNLHYYEGR